MNNIVPASNVTVIEPPKRVQATQAQDLNNIGSKLAEARGPASPTSLFASIGNLVSDFASKIPAFGSQISTESIANNVWQQSAGAVLS